MCKYIYLYQVWLGWSWLAYQHCLWCCALALWCAVNTQVLWLCACLAWRFSFSHSTPLQWTIPTVWVGRALKDLLVLMPTAMAGYIYFMYGYILGPEEGHENNLGSGTSLSWRETAGGGPVWCWKDREGISLMHINISKAGAKRMVADTFQWCPVSGWGAVAII